MKRLFSWLTAIAVMLIACCSAQAQSYEFYCEYTPKTASGSVFYIDVFSKSDISSTVSELNFDDSIAEFKGVSAAAKTSSVRYKSEKGKARIAFADSGAVNGRLFRVSFKALQTGSVTFTLRTSQAADNDLNSITDIPDCTLTILLKEKDVVSSSTPKSSKSSQPDGSGKHSDITYGEIKDDENRLSPQGADIYDVRKGHIGTYILIGAGATLLIVLSILLGVRLGKKSAEKPLTDPAETDQQNPGEEADAAVRSPNGGASNGNNDPMTGS